MKLFRRNHGVNECEPSTRALDVGLTASGILPLEVQLEQLAEEEHRWESLILGTTHDIDVILGGIKDVHARRVALLESSDQTPGQ